MATALDVISLQQAKDHLVVDFPDHDALITRLIQTAIALVEQHTYHFLYQRVYDKYVHTKQELYEYPLTLIRLGHEDSPIQYSKAVSGNYTTVYFNTGHGEVLTMNVGYASVEDIPAPLLEACYKIITNLYENREVEKAVIPSDVYASLAYYRRYGFL